MYTFYAYDDTSMGIWAIIWGNEGFYLLHSIDLESSSIL